MSAHKKTKIALLILLFCLMPKIIFADVITTEWPLSREEIARSLGWVDDKINFCGGYYLEDAFPYTDDAENIYITTNSGFFAMRSTSVLEKEVTISRQNEELTANRAILYRDPITFKLKSTDVIGDVHVREPNTLIIAHRGHYNFKSSRKSLEHIVYRTGIIGHEIAGPKVPIQYTHQRREIASLTAWGTADSFSQTLPKIYDYYTSTFSTCPPKNPLWEMRASKITLDKNIGRGYAKNARLYIKGVPIFYTPYIEFSIDKQRKSGFLWPIPGLGTETNHWGPYLLLPFYWNMAPNFDMTITPGLITNRGLYITDNFRYLSLTSRGQVNFGIDPNDREFVSFQKRIAADDFYAKSPSSYYQAEFNRLQSDSNRRISFAWKDDSIFSDNWSSHIDFNYVSDDYFLKDFGVNINETTANQLLEEQSLYYKSQHWFVTERMQGYQTLHPIQDPLVTNAYRRFPQLVISGDYPNQRFGFEYFITSEFTHFDLRNTPGIVNNQPIGNRFHVQPGISWPYTLPYFYITPRVQLALTQYQLYQTAFTDTEGTLHRAVPIVDIMAGLFLNRETYAFGNAYQQTLEPVAYYVYIPDRNQTEIPTFDTTIKELTYESLFDYNRFSGIDRIGDANQIGFGITTRFIDQQSGYEKIRFGIAQILYFADRNVTLCKNKNLCVDYPENPLNHYRLSPLTQMFDFHISPYWTFSASSIWNTVDKQLDKGLVALHFQPDIDHALNISFQFVRDGDFFTGTNVPGAKNNLKLTNISVVTPLFNNLSFVGRWSEDWETHHFQDIIYGLQYDNCCWSIRFVGGRTFSSLKADTDNPNILKPAYNGAFYVQIDLKGLGDIGNGNPRTLLASINGYSNTFGQEY